MPDSPDPHTSYIRHALQADPVIGVGGTLSDLVRCILREVVYLRLLLGGALSLPLDELPARVQAEIARTLATMEGHDA